MITIVLADDDSDDRELVREAFDENRLSNPLVTVRDGHELMEYLRNEGAFRDRERYPRPGLILLDLNMPRKDGREALAEIKADPDLRSIPVIVLTTSQAEQDVLESYDVGANSYISKPVTVEALFHVIRILGRYWFEIVDLPMHGGSR
ncbi:MAG: response regulator [Bdellovibrionales bacterium]|nr:response regulator [Bdellovibrionales bacterium]